MGTNSDTREINTGVPQGSVLGPLFFLLYINDIVNVLNQKKATLFANDTSILLKGNDLNTLKKQAKEILKSVYEWLLGRKAVAQRDILFSHLNSIKS